MERHQYGNATCGRRHCFVGRKIEKDWNIAERSASGQVLGNASRDGFVPNVDPMDIGAGLVTAPQN